LSCNKEVLAEAEVMSAMGEDDEEATAPE